MSNPVQVAGGRLGGRIRLGCSPELIKEARQELAAAKLEQAINAAIESAPPLTDSARERLAMLLLKGGA